MANTKDLDRAGRKQAKREARRSFKARLSELNLKERRELRKYEGTRAAFIRELDEREKGDG